MSAAYAGCLSSSKQAKDRGLKEVLMGLAPGSSERIAFLMRADCCRRAAPQ
jgi:hypothetical protein